MTENKLRKRKGQVTREKFLQAGREIFQCNGYLNTEIEQVSKQAGKAKGTFYIYFKDKNQLLRELVSEFFDELKVMDQIEGNTPREQTAMLRIFWSACEKHVGTYRAMSEAATVNQEFQSIRDEFFHSGAQTLQTAIEKLQEDGRCLDLDAATTSTVLMNMIDSCVYNWVARGVDINNPDFDANNKRDNINALHTLIKVLNNVLFGEKASWTRQKT